MFDSPGEDTAKTKESVTRGTGNTTVPASRAELVPVSDMLPPSLMLIPVAQTTLFPGMIVPLVLPEGKLAKTVEYVAEGTGFVGIVLTRSHDEKAVATGPS